MSLRALRMNRGLSVADVAAETDVPLRTLYRLEAGALAPRPATAKRIADFYDVKVTDLWPVDDGQSNGNGALGAAA